MADLFCRTPEGILVNVGRLWSMSSCPNGWKQEPRNAPEIAPGSPASPGPAAGQTPNILPSISSALPKWATTIGSKIADPTFWKAASLIGVAVLLGVLGVVLWAGPHVAGKVSTSGEQTG